MAWLSFAFALKRTWCCLSLVTTPLMPSPAIPTVHWPGALTVPVIEANLGGRQART